MGFGVTRLRVLVLWSRFHWRALVLVAVSELSGTSSVLCIFGSSLKQNGIIHLKFSNTPNNKIKWNSLKVSVSPCCSVSLSLSFSVISQLLITEQVRLQPECVPAAACLSNIPSAKINRSSSLHITTYQEEGRIKGRIRRGEKWRRRKGEECHLCCYHCWEKEENLIFTLVLIW